MPLFPVAIAYQAQPESRPVLSQKMEAGQRHHHFFSRIVKVISSI